MDSVGKSYVNGRRDGSQPTTFYLISSASHHIYLNSVQHQSYNSVDINSLSNFVPGRTRLTKNIQLYLAFSHSDSKPGSYTLTPTYNKVKRRKQMNHYHLHFWWWVVLTCRSMVQQNLKI